MPLLASPLPHTNFPVECSACPGPSPSGGCGEDGLAYPGSGVGSGSSGSSWEMESSHHRAPVQLHTWGHDWRLHTQHPGLPLAPVGTEGPTTGWAKSLCGWIKPTDHILPTPALALASLHTALTACLLQIGLQLCSLPHCSLHPVLNKRG